MSSRGLYLGTTAQTWREACMTRKPNL